MKLTEKDISVITKLHALEDFEKKLLENKNIVESKIKTLDEKIKEKKNIEYNINKIIDEKTIGFPWIANIIAEYYQTLDLQTARLLENKKNPAFSSAEKIRLIAKEKTILKKEFLIAKGFVDFYESLFPWLKDLVGSNIDDILNQIRNENKTTEEFEKQDPVLKLIGPTEYYRIDSSVKRNQLALERYWKKQKSPWEIGRDYERFVGYSYEEKGYKVSYQGIFEGVSDLGRDLICTSYGNTKIVQCKYWKKSTPINENHINQLFGTTVKYLIDTNLNKLKKAQINEYSNILKETKITPVFRTTTLLSDTAREFSEALGIELIENDFFDKNYPCIKCNISKSNGNRIYHLPFDQQYDNTLINFSQGEFYAKSIEEAENKGFRRAWKWRGN